MGIFGLISLIALPIALVREQNQIAYSKAQSKAYQERQRQERIEKVNRYNEKLEAEKASGKKLNYDRQMLYYLNYVLYGKEITKLRRKWGTYDQTLPKYEPDNPYYDPYEYRYCGKKRTESGDIVLTSDWERLSKAREDFEKNEDYDWSYAYEDAMTEKFSKCYRS